MGYGQPDFLGLSKSKARRALLALFFTNSEQEYFPRQLERLSGIFVGNLQKELIKMEQAGLLESRRLGMLKLYKLNVRHPLYPELKSVVAKTVGLEETIRGELAKIEGIKAACIYGSFARGEPRARSDVDLLLLAEWRKRKAAKDSFVMEVLKQPRIPLIGEKEP